MAQGGWGNKQDRQQISLQNGSITSTVPGCCLQLLPPVMLSLPEQGPGVWEDGISHTKHCYEKARSKLKQAIKKIKGKTLAVFLHCCLAIAMTQAKLSQNPLTHNHRQTLHTQVTGTALPRSAARPAQPLQTQQGEASPGTARQGCQAPRPCLSCSVPSTKPQAHLQQELWGLQTHSPPNPARPRCRQCGPECQGLLLRADLCLNEKCSE